MNESFDIARPRGSVEIVLRGELDIARVAEVGASFLDAMSAAPSEIRLDLAEVDFIDCAALSALVAAHAAAEHSGCRVLVTALSAPARRLLVLTGMLDRFDVAAP